MKKEDTMITVKELSVLMNVSRRTIYNMLKSGKLPYAIKFGGSWRFDRHMVK